MKHLPLSTDAERALAIEAEAEQGAAADAPRRPSAGITSIHAKLGIPAVSVAPDPQPDTSDLIGSDQEEGGVSQNTTPSSAPSGEGERAPSSPVLCGEPDPIDEETCAKDAGHAGSHADPEGRTWK